MPPDGRIVTVDVPLLQEIGEAVAFTEIGGVTVKVPLSVILPQPPVNSTL